MTDEQMCIFLKHHSIYCHVNHFISLLRRIRDDALDLRYSSPEGKEDTFLRGHVDAARDALFEAIEAFRAIRKYTGDTGNELISLNKIANDAGYERIKEIFQSGDEPSTKELNVLYKFCPILDEQETQHDQENL